MLGERLKQLRLEKEMTIQGVCEFFNLTHPAWIKYEKNQGNPSVEKLIQIADFFHVTTDYLLGRSNIRNKEHEKSLSFHSNIIKSFEDTYITDPADAFFFLENLTCALDAYARELVNEASLKLLLKGISELAIYFNDLSTARNSNEDISFNTVVLQNDTSAEIVKIINSLHYVMFNRN